MIGGIGPAGVSVGLVLLVGTDSGFGRAGISLSLDVVVLMFSPTDEPFVGLVPILDLVVVVFGGVFVVEGRVVVVVVFFVMDDCVKGVDLDTAAVRSIMDGTLLLSLVCDSS
jgi:hypothetical protein